MTNKKYFVSIIIFITILPSFSFCQIAKSTIMALGSIDCSYANGTSAVTHWSNISVNLKAGYFFVNKQAFGITTDYFLDVVYVKPPRLPDNKIDYSSCSVWGAFYRYYFFNNKPNPFLENSLLFDFDNSIKDILKNDLIYRVCLGFDVFVPKYVSIEPLIRFETIKSPLNQDFYSKISLNISLGYFSKF